MHLDSPIAELGAGGLSFAGDRGTVGVNAELGDVVRPALEKCKTSHEGVLFHLALRALLPNRVAAAFASASRVFQSSGGRPRFSMRLKT
jgi:hypothetical protein